MSVAVLLFILCAFYLLSKTKARSSHALSVKYPWSNSYPTLF